MMERGHQKGLDNLMENHIMRILVRLEIERVGEKMSGFLKTSRWLCASFLVVLAAWSSAAAFTFDYTINPAIADAMTRHDTIQALNLIEADLNVDPNYAPLYLLRGQVFFARGQYDQALEQFNLALSKKSKFEEASYYKGLVLLKLGNLDKAEEAFTKGMKGAKNHQKALFHNGLGLLFLERKQYTEADLEFSKAINIAPNDVEFYANRGDAYYLAELYPMAIIEFNKVIGMDTSYLDVYFHLARAYVAQNQYNEALDQLRIVLTRDSTYSGAWKEIGRLYTLAGLSAGDRDTKEQRMKEAIGSYRKYLELSKDSLNGEVFFNLGRAYFTLGGFEDANAALERVLGLGDEPKGIYLYLGRSYVAQNMYEQGIQTLLKHFEAMKKLDPDWVPTVEDAEVYRRLGDAYKALEDWPSAADNFAKAEALDPGEPRYAMEAAVAYHQLKDYTNALVYYEKRIALGPENWNVYLNAAYCTLNMENYERAVEYLLKVVALDSTQEKAYALLSNTYMYQLQDCQNGVAWTEKWLAMDTTNCEALKSLGFAYYGGICPPDYLKAIGYFDRSLGCFKTKGSVACGSADIMLYMAQAYHFYAAGLYERNQKQESKVYYKNAFDWYNKVLKCDPGNADAKKGYDDTRFMY